MMTVCSVKTIVLLFMLLLFPATLFAQPGSFPKHWEIGTEIYHAVYEEPGIMKETGFMYGVKSAVSFHEKIVGPVDLVGIEGAYTRGFQNYSSFWTGNLDAVEVSVFEIRGSLGHDIVNEGAVWTPYLGLGYRCKKDHAYGLISTSGALGYDRESQYLYSPLGIAVATDLENGWSVGGFVEYDYFWNGTQKSLFSDLHPLNSDLVNDQDSGYGIRASVKISKQLHDGFLVVFEPFLRYWSIDQSNPGEYMEYNAFLDRVVQHTGYEPENSSLGYGVNIFLLF